MLPPPCLNPLRFLQVSGDHNSNQLLLKEEVTMSFENKSMTCSDCGATFTFTAGEQEFYASKDFTNQPKHCVRCRRARKEQRRLNNYSTSYSSRN